MNEVILKIEEVEEDESSWGGKAGYAITTDKQVIKLLIESHQDCCESWGYFMSEDNLDNFIGGEILELAITDTLLNSKPLVERNVGDESGKLYEGGIMFVNVSANKGLLQFVAYNEHNGYYGHDAYVISEQLTHEERL